MNSDNRFSDEFPDPRQTEEEEDLGPSKSELKREMIALQELGMKLMALRPGQWGQFGLQGRLREALDESLRIKSQNARRRHSRRLAKLLAEESEERIAEWIERIDHPHKVQARKQRRLEALHDELVKEGDSAINKLLDDYPNLDRQQLRNIVRLSQKMLVQQDDTTRDEKLIKYLRELTW